MRKGQASPFRGCKRSPETVDKMRIAWVNKPHEPYRWELLEKGLPALCKVHGLHTNWRIYKVRGRPANQCRFCNSVLEKKSRTKDAIHTMFVYARGRKCRGYSFDIDENFLRLLVKKQGGRCALSGIMFDAANKPSLDRKDSTKGYTEDNVQIVLYSVNMMKSYLSQEHFLAMCSVVASNNCNEYGMSEC